MPFVTTYPELTFCPGLQLTLHAIKAERAGENAYVDLTPGPGNSSGEGCRIIRVTVPVVAGATAEAIADAVRDASYARRGRLVTSNEHGEWCVAGQPSTPWSFAHSHDLYDLAHEAWDQGLSIALPVQKPLVSLQSTTIVDADGWWHVFVIR